MIKSFPTRNSKLLSSLVDRVSQSTALRSIGVLVGGTALGHAITAAAMPVATRLFSPSDFAAASAFSSIVGILVVASCLRFEMAVPIPEDDEEAASLMALSGLATVAMSLVVAVFLLIAPASVFQSLGQPALMPHLWLLPLALMLGGSYLALQMWFVRRKGFGSIARSRVFQSGAAAAGQLGLGLAGVAPLGLLVGQMLNYGAGAITLGWRFVREEWTLLRRVSWGGMKAAAQTHHRFPKFSVWEALANAASIHLPILLIASLAAGPEAGYLTLAIFLLQAPMALVGQAVGQVYLSGAPEALRDDRLAPFTLESLARLVRLSAAPLTALGVASPWVFDIVFGAGWARSGVLVAWMAPWFFFQFLASPISTVLHISNRQGWAMLLQAGGLALRVGSVVVVSMVEPRWIVEAYAVSGALFYAVYLVVAVRIAGIGALALGRLAMQAAAMAAVTAVVVTPLVIALSRLWQ